MPDLPFQAAILSALDRHLGPGWQTRQVDSHIAAALYHPDRNVSVLVSYIDVDADDDGLLWVQASIAGGDRPPTPDETTALHLAVFGSCHVPVVLPQPTHFELHLFGQIVNDQNGCHDHG